MTGQVEVLTENINLAEIDKRCRPYQPYGSALEAFYNREPEVMVEGPSGTGKSRSWLEKMHLMSSKYDGMRSLLIRKTRESLTQSGLVTFREFVLPVDETVKWRTAEQEFRYVNGSKIVVAGMDKWSKIMSTEYDLIYAMEATELTETDWEALTTRCRFGRVSYNQVVGCCNPDVPWHWIKARENKGFLKMIYSKHQHNPVLFDQVTKEWTEKGNQYMLKLQRLTGVRKLRLYKGIWAAAEGLIYNEWDPTLHLLNRNEVQVRSDWERVWVVDFGFINPFVWQCWAISPNDVAYRIAEIYQTQLLVEDAARQILSWKEANHEPTPSTIICDWDAEGRATLERHLKMGTEAAIKNVLDGIEQVKVRLKPKGKNTAPEIVYIRDSVLNVDPELAEASLPVCSEQEYDGYIWKDHKLKEQPLKANDHGMDTARYFCNWLDFSRGGWAMGAAR